MKKLILASMIAASVPALANDELLTKELGLTLGTPAGLNLVAGWWGTPELPLVVRASGMYLGSLRGIQGDVGWAFDRDGSFRQYIAATVHSTRIDTSRTLLTYTGLGGVYGFNLSGFSTQLGLVAPIGSVNAVLDSSGYRTLGAQVVLQLGYTYMW